MIGSGGISRLLSSRLAAAAALSAAALALLTAHTLARAAPNSQNRSTGIQVIGPEVRARDYPWQVALRLHYPTERRCGGVLVSRSFVLTAAHCLDGARPDNLNSRITLWHGDIEIFHGVDRYAAGTRLEIDRNWPVTLHPSWKTSGIVGAWDVALVKLAQPVAMTVTTAPVGNIAFDEGMAVVSGWGAYDASELPSDTLRAANVPVTSNARCRLRLAREDAVRVGDFTLCTESPTADACGRDSGGPLVAGTAASPQTVGIVSWGPSGASCGRTRDGTLVGLYARTSQVASWIFAQTGDRETVTSAAPGTTFRVQVRVGNES